MQIDVISDPVCPWCFIAKRRLARALAQRPDVPFEVYWRPYRLDPTIPKEGYDRHSYMNAKFANEIGNMHQLLTAEGAKEGILFDFAAIRRSPNTIDAHRLIRWAETSGVQDDVAERLFIAYFENGDDISDIRVLADIADLCGMDGVEVAELLESDADIGLVEREEQLAVEMGVTGVPAMIFGGKLVVPGACDPEVLLAIIDQVLAGSQAQADSEDTEEE
jgi:predicted DsbA family dithiol-disulfide isomerase